MCWLAAYALGKVVGGGGFQKISSTILFAGKSHPFTRAILLNAFV